jgi:hypothetical protein
MMLGADPLGPRFHTITLRDSHPVPLPRERQAHYGIYDVLPVGQRYSGTSETHDIERDNARQRHWLARFRRRSIVVSKAKRMVDVSIALFARFAGNNRIADLISMLA